MSFFSCSAIQVRCSIVVVLGLACLSAANSCVAAESKEQEKVLRHAVFFKFKDGTPKEDVRKVVDAFRSLPEKIEEIRGFELGEVLPESGRNDGLTHGFFLTFADEAGRATYLPHPAHKEFGSVLRPHLDKVFVIDYWGKPVAEPPKRSLKHAVFFKFKEGTSAEAKKQVEEGLSSLPAEIEEIKAFEWGTNNSPETHDQGFTHCFMLTFDSEKDLQTYSDHPTHVAVAKDLVPKMEKIRVIDFFADQVPILKSNQQGSSARTP